MSTRTDALVSQPETGKMTASIFPIAAGCHRARARTETPQTMMGSVAMITAVSKPSSRLTAVAPITCVSAASLSFLLLAGAPGLAGDAAKGKATFISICSSCHGLDGIATLDYAPSFAKCQRLDQDDAKLLVSVRDGIGGRMPPWGTYLNEQEILDALAYARTFCRVKERDHP